MLATRVRNIVDGDERGAIERGKSGSTLVSVDTVQLP
jgi:hypothetical protein